MRMIEAEQATAPLSEYARDASKEPVILTVDGKPVAALVPIHNADVETVTLSTHTVPGLDRTVARTPEDGGWNIQQGDAP